MNILAKIISGSRLYGCSSPETSDTDIQGIFKAPLQDIILKRDQSTFSVKNGLEGPAKVEEEYHELRTFIRGAQTGQSYAIDILFAPDEMILEDTPTYKFLRENRNKLIGGLKPMLEYCRVQAKKYSQKAHRLDSLKKCEEYYKKFPVNVIINNFPFYLDEFCYLESRETRIGEEHFYHVVSNDYHRHVKVSYLLQGLRTQIKKYGKRANDYLVSRMDFKAYYSAVRIALAYIELAKTGNLQLPMKHKDILLEIKLGRMAVDTVEAYLLHLLEEADKLKYKGEIDTEFWSDWMVRQYIT